MYDMHFQIVVSNHSVVPCQKLPLNLHHNHLYPYRHYRDNRTQIPLTLASSLSFQSDDQLHFLYLLNHLIHPERKLHLPYDHAWYTQHHIVLYLFHIHTEYIHTHISS